MDSAIAMPAGISPEPMPRKRQIAEAAIITGCLLVLLPLADNLHLTPRSMLGGKPLIARHVVEIAIISYLLFRSGELATVLGFEARHRPQLIQATIGAVIVLCLLAAPANIQLRSSPELAEYARQLAVQAHSSPLAWILLLTRILPKELIRGFLLLRLGGSRSFSIPANLAQAALFGWVAIFGAIGLHGYQFWSYFGETLLTFTTQAIVLGCAFQWSTSIWPGVAAWVAVTLIPLVVFSNLPPH